MNTDNTELHNSVTTSLIYILVYNCTTWKIDKQDGIMNEINIIYTLHQYIP